jgi:hypothetical protein
MKNGSLQLLKISLEHQHYDNAIEQACDSNHHDEFETH